MPVLNVLVSTSVSFTCSVPLTWFFKHTVKREILSYNEFPHLPSSL
jgi:hypothetical protein